MDLGYVKKLVKLLSESEIDEIEVEEEGKRVRVARHAKEAARNGQVGGVPVAHAVIQPIHAGQAEALPVQSAPAAPAQSPAVSQKLHEIKSPIVGTFYRSPAPDAAPFVQVGTAIEPGTVLCIVEAMKLMNEIESDTAGKIAKVMVENGQPVEYGQTLFLVETA